MHSTSTRLESGKPLNHIREVTSCEGRDIHSTGTRLESGKSLNHIREVTSCEAEEWSEPKNYNTHAKLCDICTHNGQQAAHDVLDATRRNNSYNGFKTRDTFQRKTKTRKKCGVRCKTCRTKTRQSCATVSFKDDHGDMPDYLSLAKSSYLQRPYFDFSHALNKGSSVGLIECGRTSDILTTNKLTKTPDRVVCNENYTSNASSSSPAILELMTSSAKDSARNTTSLHVRRPTVHLTGQTQDAAGHSPADSRRVVTVPDINVPVSNMSSHVGDNDVISLDRHETSSDSASPTLVKYPVKSNCRGSAISTDISSSDETNNEVTRYVSTCTELNINSSNISINSNNGSSNHYTNRSAPLHYVSSRRTNSNVIPNKNTKDRSTDNKRTRNKHDNESCLMSSETEFVTNRGMSNKLRDDTTDIDSITASDETTPPSDETTSPSDETTPPSDIATASDEEGLDDCSANSVKFKDNAYDSTLCSVSDVANEPNENSNYEMTSLSNTADMCTDNTMDSDNNPNHNITTNRFVDYDEYSDTSSDATVTSECNNVRPNRRSYTSNLFLNPNNRQIIPLTRDLTSSSTSGESVVIQSYRSKDMKSTSEVMIVGADEWNDLTNSDDRIHGGNRSSHNYSSSETLYRCDSTTQDMIDPRYKVFNTILVHTLTGMHLQYNPPGERFVSIPAESLPVNVSKSSPACVGHPRVISSLFRQNTAQSLPAVSNHFIQNTSRCQPINLCKSKSSPARTDCPHICNSKSSRSVSAIINQDKRIIVNTGCRKKSQSEFYDLSSRTRVQGGRPSSDWKLETTRYPSTNLDIQQIRKINNRINSVQHSSKEIKNKTSQTDFYNLDAGKDISRNSAVHLDVNQEIEQLPMITSPEYKLKSNLVLHKRHDSSSERLRDSSKSLTKVSKIQIGSQQQQQQQQQQDDDVSACLSSNESDQSGVNISKLVMKSNPNLGQDPRIKKIIRPQTSHNPILQAEVKEHSQGAVLSDNEVNQGLSYASIPVEVWGAKSVNRGFIEQSGIISYNKCLGKTINKLTGSGDDDICGTNLSHVSPHPQMSVNVAGTHSPRSRSDGRGSIISSPQSALIAFATIPSGKILSKERRPTTCKALNQTNSQRPNNNNVSSRSIRTSSPPKFSVTLSSGLKGTN